MPSPWKIQASSGSRLTRDLDNVTLRNQSRRDFEQIRSSVKNVFLDQFSDKPKSTVANSISTAALSP